MKISQTGLDLIKSFEGCSLKAYKCPAGVWTIGYGHTGEVDGVPVGSGMVISPNKAQALLATVLEQRYEPAVRRFTDLNQNQYDALVSFCYNLGPGIFTGSLLTAIQNKNWTSVADQILLYNKARVNGVLTELAGLTRRRQAESDLFLKEAYIVEKIKINLNGKEKTVNAIQKDGNNYVKLQDLRDEKIEVGYDKMPVIQVK
jgi:lysozyme